MKLELKHLAPYLPYGLKCIYKPTNKKMTIDGISFMFGDYCIHMKENSDGHGFDFTRPILRPLSDLTKDINVFVEIFSLCTGINYTKHEVETTFDSRSTDKNYYLLTELNRQISISYDDDLKVFRYFNSKGESNQMKTQLDLFNVLFKNHFDVFGLINRGLAVDINTLN